MCPRPVARRAVANTGAGGLARTIVVAAALGLLIGAGAGCKNGGGSERVIRIGYFANVTHLVPLVAARRGSFEKALAPYRVEWKVFGAGPEAMEALLADAIDATYVGPGPAQVGYLRSRGEAMSLVAGAASGGVQLVVRKAANVHSAADLRGKKIATPQLGNTQDIALRTWLSAHGLNGNAGGDVQVVPIANSTAAQMIKNGGLDGAWVPEPWGSILRAQADCETFVDERDLWPNRRFAITELVVATAALANKRDALARLVGAHVDEVTWVRAHALEAQKLVAEQLASITGKPLPNEILGAALATVEATWDPMPGVLVRLADQARSLNYLPKGDLTKLVDRTLLDAALVARGLSAEPPPAAPAAPAAPAPPAPPASMPPAPTGPTRAAAAP